MALFKVDSVTLKEKAFGGRSTESGVAGVPFAKRNSEDRLSPHFLTYTIRICIRLNSYVFSSNSYHYIGKKTAPEAPEGDIGAMI